MVIIVKKIFLLLMSMFLMVGVSGCMNTNKYSKEDMEIKARLMQYAEEKYGGSYQEVSYRTAADYTRSYDLCLKDSKGRIFNVSEDASSGFQHDDYLESIVDDKMRKYLLEYLDGMLNEYSISAMTSMDIFIDKESLEEMTINECIDKFGLESLVFVCQFDETKGRIKDRGEDLVKIYQKLREIGSKVINYNVVVTAGDDSEVKNIFKNMRDLYTGCWYTCKNVKEYIADAINPINTVEDLNLLVKE